MRVGHIPPHADTASLQHDAALFGGTLMEEERRLSNSRLFASWAGEDFGAWQRATGASVTHLSRGVGQVTNISQDAGTIAIHVQYERSERRHALWEFRTEFIDMTYQAGLTRADLLPTVAARRLQRDHATQTTPLARRSGAA